MSAFEFHGWAALRDTHHQIELDHDAELESKLVLKTAVAEIKNYLHEQFKFPSSLHLSNGSHYLTFSGCSNHYRDAPLDLFKFVNLVAPGSYGLLYILDTEDKDWRNQMQVWVLKRTTLSRHGDPFLSPFNNECEEYY